MIATTQNLSAYATEFRIKTPPISTVETVQTDDNGTHLNTETIPVTYSDGWAIFTIRVVGNVKVDTGTQSRNFPMHGSPTRGASGETNERPFLGIERHGDSLELLIPYTQSPDVNAEFYHNGEKLFINFSQVPFYSSQRSELVGGVIVTRLGVYLSSLYRVGASDWAELNTLDSLTVKFTPKGNPFKSNISKKANPDSFYKTVYSDEVKL